MQKLTIVVNCTDRKTVAPTLALRARSLPPGDTASRFATWRQRVATADRATQLMDLYKGEAWQQAKALAADARSKEKSVRMLVASAGLGLTDVTEQVPSYAATFTGGHADSIATDLAQLPDWWKRLRDLPRTESLRDIRGSRILLVLSENYARAMHEDLAYLGTQDGDYLLVGGWRAVEGIPRIPADRDLRQALGGTVSSLTLRMARRWLSERAGERLYTPVDAKRWSTWAKGARRSELYGRKVVSDDEIVDLIIGAIHNEPGLSATRALRMVRDRGVACEQKRFGALFRSTVTTR